MPFALNKIVLGSMLFVPLLSLDYPVHPEPVTGFGPLESTQDHTSQNPPALTTPTLINILTLTCHGFWPFNWVQPIHIILTLTQRSVFRFKIQ